MTDADARLREVEHQVQENGKPSCPFCGEKWLGCYEDRVMFLCRTKGLIAHHIKWVSDGPMSTNVSQVCWITIYQYVRAEECLNREIALLKAQIMRLEMEAAVGR